MSRFQSARLSMLSPYTPGEQPRDMKYVKLNTNESPFSPSHKAQKMAAEAARNLQLYSDPTCRVLVDKLAEVYGVDPEDKNLRLAPTYPSDSDLAKATEILVVCVKLAALEKLLEV